MIKNIYAFTVIGGLLSTFIHLMNEHHYWAGSSTVLWLLVVMLVISAIYLAPFYIGQKYLVKWSLASKLAVIALSIYALYVFFGHIIEIDEKVIKPIENGYAIFKQNQFLRMATLEEYQHSLAQTYSMASVLMMVYFFTLFNIALCSQQHDVEE